MEFSKLRKDQYFILAEEAGRTGEPSFYCKHAANGARRVIEDDDGLVVSKEIVEVSPTDEIVPINVRPRDFEVQGQPSLDLSNP